jgi:class 3 adenylate cyclase/mono/diheme cytochrome c family protein
VNLVTGIPIILNFQSFNMNPSKRLNTFMINDTDTSSDNGSIVSAAIQNHRSKLAVILHADICDSTGLLQQHEILAHARIKDSFRRLGAVVSSYNGQVCELRGDAIVAQFGRASDAVVASMAFQEQQSTHIAKFDDGINPRFRIGIALGEVIVDSNVVTGVGVVLAQRAEQLAPPDGICITAAIHEALPKRMPFELASLGYQEFKGFAEAIRVYRVTLRTGEIVPPPMEPEKRRGLTKGRAISMSVAMLALLLASGMAIDKINKNSHASHWLAPITETNQQNPIPLTNESMQKGARIFQKNCATCHGENADGNGVAGLNFKIQPANLRAMARTHKDGEFAYKIREGRGDMPSWELVLTDTDIWNLVNYIKTLDEEPTPIKNNVGEHDHPKEHGHTS